MMKALRHLFAALPLLWCSVAASAQTFEVDGLSYTVLSAEDYTVSVENGNPVIEEVVIPATVTYEGIEYRVTEIKTHGFSAGDSPTSIVIPESVTKIGEFAFYNSHLLESITFSENSQLTSIEECAFFGCQNLQGIEIPASVTYIGPSAFSGCRYGLTSIAIPEGVTSIGGRAFADCTSLESVTIPGSVTSIGALAFSGCTSLTSITIPEGVTEIGNSAFVNCTSLTSVTIPNSVTLIGDHAFADCTSLEDIPYLFSSQLTEIGDYAFYNCNSLTSIYFQADGPTSIGSSAFEGCSKLSAIAIPNVGEIRTRAFYNCSSIEGFTIYTTDNVVFGSDAFYGTAWYNNHPDGVVYFDNNLYKYKGEMPENTSIEIEEGTKTIAYGAFANCTNLTSVTIPSSVTSIGEYAFYNCTSLEDIPSIFGSQLAEIGNYAFYNCSNLTVFYCYNTSDATTIGLSAFEGCSELSSIYVQSVEMIGTKAFYNCSSLYNPNIITTVNVLIGGEAFDGTMWYNNHPDGVVYHREHLYKYKGEMSENTSIEIEEGTQTIAWEAFSGCTNLTSVTIPKSVTMILAYAFRDCTNLTSITCEAVTPPTIYMTDAFVGVDRSIPLYVPTAAMSAYKEAAFWSDFTNIQPYGHTINYVVDGETVHTTYDVREGTSVSHPKPEKRKGYTFHWELNEAINIKDNADAMLYTNAKCTNEKWGDQFTSWNVLFDGNASTFFHSEYSAGVNSEDGLDHYLRVDMGEGKSVSKFTFTYTVRGEIPYMGNYSPKQMVVEGSNEANGEYEEIALLANLPEEGGAVYNSPVLSNGNGNAYRYIRFRVTETYQNVKVEGHPYFFMAEFGMEKYTIINDNFVMPAKDIVINGVYTARVNLIEDGSIESIYQLGDIDYAEITYVRTFNNTNWQSLYVPFDIDYEVIKEDFDVAYINDVHQFDDDNDGSIDRTQVEAIKMVSGTLDANYPYLIRAKEVGEKTITVEDAVMYATKENSIDCSSVFRNYTFTGSYRTRTAEDLPASEGYYALAGGEWKQLSETAQLGAFRVYLKIDSRVAGEEAAAAISMRVVGDESGEGTTSIENSKADVDNHAVIYDLQGRRVENPTKGVYIVNGVKRVF